MIDDGGEWFACVCGARYRSRGVALLCCSGRDWSGGERVVCDGGEVGGPQTFGVDMDRDPDTTISRLDEAVRQLEAASYVETDQTVRQDIAFLRKRADALVDDLKERGR